MCLSFGVAMFNRKPQAGNSREFPGSWETGGKFSDLGNFPYLGKFPNHGKFPGNGKFLGIPVWEIPGREISQASREGGNGNFPLKITALGGDGDVAGATCKQRTALSALWHEFDDVF